MTDQVNCKPDDLRKDDPKIKFANEMYEALVQITKREGAYSRDILTFANNTIEGMAMVAESVLAKIHGENPENK